MASGRIAENLGEREERGGKKCVTKK